MALTDNLVAYYELEETSSSTASDSHSTNDGTYQGDLPTSTTGKINNAQDLDGAGDWINCGDLGELSSAFTVNFWFNPDSTGVVIPISYNNDSNNLQQIRVDYDPSGNQKLRYAFHDTNGDFQSFISTNAIGTGDGWAMVTLTWDGTTLQGYINAGDEGSITPSLNPTASTEFAIGARNRTSGLDLEIDGQMDEVGIWSRALTSTEVTELYNSGNGLAYPFVQNVTITPSALTLSTSLETAEDIVIQLASSFNLTLNLLRPERIQKIKDPGFAGSAQLKQKLTDTSFFIRRVDGGKHAKDIYI